MEEKLKKTLKDGAKELGAELSDEALDLFQKYLAELKVWNKKINLTSIDSDEEIVKRHFLDSFTPYSHIKGSKSLLDIGAGGGFPGIPLKIAFPDIKVVLMDSVEKKVHFMRHIIRTLGLAKTGDGIEAIAARVEDPSVVKKYSESFDCVISRAFTELKGFLTLGLPYLRPGGRIIALKGPAYAEELKGAGGIMGITGPEVFEVRVPFTDRTTTVIIFKKG